MKIINVAALPITLAHGEIHRKAIITPGGLKSSIQTINLAWIEPGQSFTPHAHPDCEELFLFVRGRGEMIIDNTVFRVRKGMGVLVEPGESHSIRNKTPHRLDYYSIRALLVGH